MKSKSFIIKIVILTIISLVGIIFVYHDYFLYQTPILKIKDIKTEVQQSDSTHEKYYNQIVTGKIQNGKYKGKKLTFQNSTTTSGVYDEKLHKNSELFVELAKDGSKVISISNIKRDKYLVILLVLFIDLIILVASKKGLLTLFSLSINILITALSILIFQKYYRTLNMLLLYFIVAIIFIIFSLFITNGNSKKTLAAILSSICSLFVSFGLAFLLIKLYGKAIPFWTLEYIEAVRDYENFFYVSILLCGLGAIMDIAITMSSSLNELIEKDNKITLKALLKSGREISKDIVGTMTNVMLFTCYTSIIPTVLLAIKNNMALADTLSRYGQVELIIILTSCISIVLTIPISLYISAFLLKSKNREAIK